jgi:hypothetical protein
MSDWQYETSWQARRAESIQRASFAKGHDSIEGVGLILDSVANHLIGTGGELSEKAVDEIAWAYMQGAKDSARDAFLGTDITQARSAILPLLTAINQVR